MYIASRIPTINFEATCLLDLVEKLTIEPALTREYTLDELQNFMVQGSFKVPFENHSQVSLRWYNIFCSFLLTSWIVLHLCADKCFITKQTC